MHRLSNKFHKKVISATRLLSIMAILSLSCSSFGQETLTVGNAKTVMVSRLAGSADGTPGSTDGAGEAARFGSGFNSIAVDGAGNAYVADARYNVIRKITPAGVVSTLAGTAGVKGSANGTGAAASFNNLQGIAVDGAGNVYVTDDNDIIRKITPAGVVSTLAGSVRQGLYAPEDGSTADGKGTAARFNLPHGIAIDSAGNLYIADSDNELIRKITPDGMVSTLAGGLGNGARSDTNGKGGKAGFSSPEGIAVDGAGNVYVTESGMNTVRKITPDGMVSTFAGAREKAGSADGAGINARFDMLRGLATDSAGNVYAADEGNNTIRKITPTGVVSTLAGAVSDGCGTTTGEGSVVRFCYPSGIATDKAGNVYVMESTDIRKITPK